MFSFWLCLSSLTLSPPRPTPPDLPSFSVCLFGGDEAIFILYTFALLLQPTHIPRMCFWGSTPLSLTGSLESHCFCRGHGISEGPPSRLTLPLARGGHLSAVVRGLITPAREKCRLFALWCRQEDVPFLFAATMTNVHLCFMVKRQATLCTERFQEDSGWALGVLQGLHCTACYL